MNLWKFHRRRNLDLCHIVVNSLPQFKIAELSGKAETPIRTEGHNGQGQSIVNEIISPRGRDTRDSEKICRTIGNNNLLN
jgi:hypothetical protein